MSILFIFENKDPAPWKKALKAKLPNTSIEVYPTVKNKAAIDFIICWKPKEKIFKEFPNVKVIQSIGASIDHITSSQIIGIDTIITRIVDERLSHDMWEFLLTIVLSEIKNKNTYSDQQTKHIWKQHDYKTSSNTTIAILGLGKIGYYTAERFSQLGFVVKGWSTSEKKISKVKSYYLENDFDTFLHHTDFLINLLPLTDKTKGILNKSIFEILPNDAYIINVGRGEHLVETDLIEALDDSKLSGAFLDVFINEPLPQKHPFWNHPKIQITPHIASLTNINTAIDQVIENYKRFLGNKEIANSVSLKKGY